MTLIRHGIPRLTEERQERVAWRSNFVALSPSRNEHGQGRTKTKIKDEYKITKERL